VRLPFEAILGAIADGITVQGRAGELVWANDAAARLVGCRTADEMIRMPIEELLGRFLILDEKGDRMPLDKLPGRLALQGIEPPETVVRYKNLLDDTTRWTSLRSRPVFGADGRVEMAINLFRDITEERTLRKKLEEDARQRQDLLAVVSHDLKNPLTAILTSSTLLERGGSGGPEGERVRKLVDPIRRSAELMNRLIRDLLDLAAIEAGALVLDRREIDADGLIEEALEVLRPVAAGRSLHLTHAKASSTIWVRCDRNRVLQVLSNLIGNAIKYTPEGGTVSVRVVARGREEACFVVADTGIGISPEALPRVFERYWQARRIGFEGVGLGLSIAKGVVDAHGGRIWAESRPGHGSTFFFTLGALSVSAEP
jgi:PAS domain S-box-containing protein